MKPVNSNQLKYTPGPCPIDVGGLQSYLTEELLKIASIINQVSDGQLAITETAPAKPRDGMIRYADGTNWNPGSGKGFYGYYSSAWHLLG